MKNNQKKEQKRVKGIFSKLERSESDRKVLIERLRKSILLDAQKN